MFRSQFFRPRTALVACIVCAMAATAAVTVWGLFGHDPASGTAEAAPPAAPPTPTPQKAAPPPKPADPLDHFSVKRILKIDGKLDYGDYVWDDQGAPAGPVVVTVDLKAQTLSVFRAGHEIGVAVILYGAGDKPSPLGTFPIMEKDADHVSNLYNAAPMPYALRLTGDGVFIHGSDVEYGSATHGCIGVPKAFAKKLFGQARIGDLVIITDGKMMDLGGAAPAQAG